MEAIVSKAQIIVALDYPNAGEAMSFVDRVGDSCDFYKVGLELFVAAGPSIVGTLKERGKRVFLDLKLHDIPNTVRGAAASAAALGADLLTVHISGGAEMMRAAAVGAGNSTVRRQSGDLRDEKSTSGCEVFGVSVLTSMDDHELARVWGREGISSGDEVIRLSDVAVAAGITGMVCSGQEAAAVKRKHGSSLSLLVPGIRLAGGPTHDQARVVTPRTAQDAGADYLVLGRAVTGASNPAAVLAEIVSSLA